MTSAHWRKFLPGLRGQGTSRVRPFEWFGHRPVEVVNKSQNTLAELHHRGETSPLEQAAHQDAEPEFNLIQP